MADRALPWNVKREKPPPYRITIEFLEQLRPGGPWVLTAIIPDGLTKTITAATHEQVIAFVQKHDGKENLYFSVNPTRAPVYKKATKSDIAAVEYLLADLDPRHDETAEDAKKRYIGAITAYNPAATAVIDSGNGLQALWKLVSPIPLPLQDDNKFSAATLSSIADIEARSELLMQQLGSAAGTQNIDRILRLPGTTNIPNKKKAEAGRVACPTALIRFNELVYELHDFPAAEQRARTETGNGKATNLGLIFKQLPAALKKALAAHAYDSEDTSETAASVITQLQARGLQDSEIAALIRAFPDGLGKRYAQGKNLDADIARLRAKYQATQKGSAKTSSFIKASDIVPRAKNWLWKGHLLRGSLELMTGIPGLGKSQVQISLVASATAGLPWPDGIPAGPPVNVIMLTAEDVLAQEVIPRLMAAGVDRERVHILNRIKSDGKDRQFLLGEDLDELERLAMEWGDVGLVTVDPITAYMGKIDSHKATEVRSQLGPLKDFCERTNIAVSAITHPPKSSSGKAIDQFIGSQAFIAAGRIGHLCVEEFEEGDDGEKHATGRMFFTNPKTNAYVKMPTVAYRIEEVFVAYDDSTGEAIASPRAVWDGEILSITADEAVAAAASNTPKAKSAKRQQDKVQEALIEMLKENPPGSKPVRDIEVRMEKLGFTEYQLRQARKNLGAVVENVHGVWHLRLIM